MITQADFWNLIALSLKGNLGDKAAQCQKLQEQLLALSPEDIVQFQHRFDGYLIQAYTWDLWAVATLIGRGCSDNCFIDFRSWLISKGKDVYEAAMKEPDSLAQSITEKDGDCQFELFQYVAIEAWAKKAGRSADDFPYGGNIARKAPAGQEWRYDARFQQRFPQLCARFESNFLQLSRTLH
ncbi:MAG: hypothetical protein BroJett011_42390 [Chloroflexota bacterium]|nr:MAG: hypothetical protein BroJett011_42390 [Chloroflexota bacterium]